MAKTYNSAYEIQVDLTNKLSLAIEKVADQLTEVLKDIIEKNVYSYDEQWNGRTYEFLDSWINTKPVISGAIVSATIEQDISVMQINYENFSHIDRDMLAEIIETGIGYDFAYNVGERPFWDEFVTYVNVNMWFMIKDELQAMGVYMTT